MAASTALTWKRKAAGGWLALGMAWACMAAGCGDGGPPSPSPSPAPPDAQAPASPGAPPAPKPSPDTTPTASSPAPAGQGAGAQQPGTSASQPATPVTPAAPAIDEKAWPAPSNAPLATLSVKLGDRTFALEKALTNQQRFGGLSGRREIAADGGMLFVFKNPQPLAFVMRDCPIPIDIIYLDASGRITAMHHMQPEPPRAENEKPVRDDRLPAWAWTNDAYEARLKRYPSRFPAVAAIELRANTLNIENSNPGALTLRVGDKIEGLDLAALRKAAE